jgi:tetratricopeptide (TPR) repeat protein
MAWAGPDPAQGAIRSGNSGVKEPGSAESGRLLKVCEQYKDLKVEEAKTCVNDLLYFEHNLSRKKYREMLSDLSGVFEKSGDLKQALALLEEFVGRVASESGPLDAQLSQTFKKIEELADKIRDFKKSSVYTDVHVSLDLILSAKAKNAAYNLPDSVAEDFVILGDYYLSKGLHGAAIPMFLEAKRIWGRKVSSIAHPRAIYCQERLDLINEEMQKKFGNLLNDSCDGSLK